MIMKKIKTGRVMIVEAAMMGPQSFVLWPKNVRNPTETVYFDESDINVNANMNSFQAVMNAKIDVDTRPGVTNGKRMRQNICHQQQPSIYAESSSYLGTAPPNPRGLQ